MVAEHLAQQLPMSLSLKKEYELGSCLSCLNGLTLFSLKMQDSEQLLSDIYHYMEHKSCNIL